MNYDKAILKNLANWLMLEQCKKLDIDCSDTHVVETVAVRRQRNYALVKNDTNYGIILVTFTKNNAPQFNKN